MRTLFLCFFWCIAIGAGTSVCGQSSQCSTPEGPKLSNEEVIEQFGPGKIHQRNHPSVYLIPIVFYIYHNNQPFTIREGQVLAQLDKLNRDFAPYNVQFCLATKEDGHSLPLPQGPTIVETHAVPEHPGIMYVNDPTYGTLGGFGYLNPSHEIAVNQYSGLNSDEYLKVFLLDFAQGSYTYYPNLVPLNRVGIYMSHHQFGISGICHGCYPEAQHGTFLTHEVGHFLNLYHVLDINACGETNCQTQGDFCCDTPPINFPVNFGGCRQQNLSGCPETSPALLDNYMDYVRSECMNSFTPGQFTRMRTSLLTYPQRVNLWSAANHQQTGVTCRSGVFNEEQCRVTTYFTAQNDPSNNCQVIFRDQTWFHPGGVPIEWHWEFGDGNVSNLQNPRHQYATSGSYPVCLTAHAQTSIAGVRCVERYCSTITVDPCQPLPNQGCSVSVNPDIWPLNCYTEFRANVSIPANATLESIEWNFGDGNFSNHPQTVHRYEHTGPFEVILTADVVTATGEHCQTTYYEKLIPDCNLTFPQRLGVTASNNEFEHTSLHFLVYPNPGKDLVSIAGEWDELPQIELMDLHGKRVPISIENRSQGLSFKVDHLSNGVYFIRLSSGGSSDSRMLMIQH